MRTKGTGATVRDIYLASLQSAAYCDTGRCAGLSHDIITEMNVLIPGLLRPVRHRLIRADSRVHLYLQAYPRQSLYEVLDRFGSPVTVISCYRTVCQQLLLHAWAAANKCGIPVAAPVGQSNHEDASALDIDPWKQLKPHFLFHRWRWLGMRDRKHFDREIETRDSVGNVGVKAFQRLWNRHCTAALRLAEDGVFGPKTEAALWKAPADGWSDEG